MSGSEPVSGEASPSATSDWRSVPHAVEALAAAVAAASALASGIGAGDFRAALPPVLVLLVLLVGVHAVELAFRRGFMPVRLVRLTVATMLALFFAMMVASTAGLVLSRSLEYWRESLERELQLTFPLLCDPCVLPAVGQERDNVLSLAATERRETLTLVFTAPEGLRFTERRLSLGLTEKGGTRFREQIRETVFDNSRTQVRLVLEVSNYTLADPEIAATLTAEFRPA